MVWSFTQVCHMDTVCGCQWFSVEILQCLLSSNCVLCTGKWHCDACTWFLRTLSLVLFVLFFLFPLLIVFSILVCNKIYNVNNFWVLENHSPWRRNERHRWHLKTTSGCVAQAGPKLILLPPVFLMLKFRVGATMHGSWYTPQWKTQHFSLRSRTRPWCPFLIGNCFRSSKKRKQHKRYWDARRKMERPQGRFSGRAPVRRHLSQNACPSVCNFADCFCWAFPLIRSLVSSPFWLLVLFKSRTSSCFHNTHCCSICVPLQS